MRPAETTGRMLALVVAASLAGGALLSSGNATLARFVLAAAAGMIFLVLASANMRLALASIIVWLVLLGFIRRLLIPFLGWSQNDPLLLVAPACGAIILAITDRDRVPRRDPLTPFVVFLLLWCLAEVVNPAQGSAAIGAKGLLTWVGPLIWFFVGKRLSADDDRFVRRVLLWTLIPVLALGLYHSFIGLLPFEYRWVGVSDFGPALFIDNFKIRPFSTLTSPQEYGFILAIAMAFIWPLVMAGPHRRRWGGLLFLTFSALVLQSSRGLVVFFVAMVLLTTMLWFRSAALNLVLGALAAFVFIIGSGAHAQIELGKDQPWVFVEHTVNGLLNPNESTLPLHKELIRNALGDSTREPLGRGVGAGSLAGRQVGKLSSAENDFATSAISLGLFPALVFEALVAVSIGIAIRRFRRTRVPHDLGTVALFVVCLTQWWAVSMYAATMLLWLAIGTLSAAEARHAEQSDPHREPAHAVA
jgi:hypothetical protein